MYPWIAHLWEYFQATYGYWWGTLAVLTAIERLTERLFHGFWRKYVDPWITPERRKQVLLFFVVTAFVIGNFRAFDAEREAKELAQAAAKPHLDPTALYQDGFAVASIIEPDSDVVNNLMVFPAVTASRELELNKEFEFRNWKLLCFGQTGAVMTFGAMRQITYPAFTCRIQGAR
jgi:hypothetical protein